MLRILGSPHKLCDGVTRRDFLHVGGLGMLGLTYVAQFEQNFAGFGGRSRRILELFCSENRFRACSEDLPP